MLPDAPIPETWPLSQLNHVLILGTELRLKKCCEVERPYALAVILCLNELATTLSWLLHVGPMLLHSILHTSTLENIGGNLLVRIYL